ncbi:MAG TPA: FAD-dependent oxidoreductase [Steroidobacteraceae bacterium]|nr:FAD-dependent oxidoreductase [Steroidobacteraceae bacterium]
MTVTSTPASPEAATSLAAAAPHCLYAETATPATAAPALASALQVEILVVGAGYTGLSAALHLAERGKEVALLEACEPGFGAAGRNGGQINAGLKYEPDVAERMLGPLFGPRLTQRALHAPEFLFGLIERLGLECEARRCGTLRAAYARPHVAALDDSAEQWRRRGVPVELWGRVRMEEATGTARYVRGLFDPNGGSLNPLSFARGLANAARRAGVRLYGSTRVRSLGREAAGWRARTAGGDVLARKVVIATDGYSDGLWPGLRRSVVPLYSAIIATSPMPSRCEPLPGRQVVYESGRITVYYRRDAFGRLLMGGRGLQRAANAREDYRHLMGYARTLWPTLEHIEWTHWWNGQFAVTPDFLPRFHMPERDLYILLGYSGRGLALGPALGAELAAVVAGAPPDSFPLPISPIRPIRWHRFWRLGVGARIWQGRLLDRLGR